jgi:chemotaxis protein MotB
MAKRKSYANRSTRFSSVSTDTVDDGDGNWLISYADMMTLLWGFFVVLTIFSTPDPEKMERLREVTAKAMGGGYEKPFNEVGKELKQVVRTMDMGGDIKVDSVTDGIRITSDAARFFDSGSADLYPDAQAIIIELGQILKNTASGFQVIVEGHTDDVPINTKKFPSNWELSLRRASEVVRLFESMGMRHEILRPIGMADIQPLVDIVGLDGKKLVMARRKNRRVVIKIQKRIRKMIL